MAESSTYLPHATPALERWAGASSYDRYVGRWSRLVAREFLAWLAAPRALDWLDVGCGTGALSDAIREGCAPAAVLSLDRSYPFAAAARASTGTGGFVVADGCALPLRRGRCDVAVSGLVLNFVPGPAEMIARMRECLKPGGVLAVYVWDYAGRMELMRYFWDAAAELDPRARALDEGVRFPICRPEPLQELFESGDLAEVQVSALDVPTVFRDFDDVWLPFLGGQGPAPGYVDRLTNGGRTRLRELLRARLPRAKDGSIHLVARAWAARGRVAGGVHGRGS